MQGYFDLQVKDARGVRAQELDWEELLSLPTEAEARGKNLCTDNLPAWLFKYVLGGPNIGTPYNNAGIGQAGLASINVQKDAADPGYTDDFYYYGNVHDVGDDVTTGDSGKSFIVDDTEPHAIFTDPDGRESLAFRSRFLYLPGEVVSSEIRSIAYYFATYPNNPNTERGPFGRFRIRDAGGNPITLNKVNGRVLLVEVTLKFTSV